MSAFEIWLAASGPFRDLTAQTGDVRSWGAKPTSRGHQYAMAQRKIDRSTTLRQSPMQKPPLDPDVADTAPSDPVLTVYDEEHIITYLRLLDANADGADWREVARIVLHLDPEHDSDRARRAFDSHLSRAKWMTEERKKSQLIVPLQGRWSSMPHPNWSKQNAVPVAR